MSAHDRLWAIILAAGEGKRLASLTERLYGEAMPKQFAVLAGNRSLLQATIDRLQPLVSASRMVIVVPLAYERLARGQLADHPGVRIVVQPANRGTGPGILLPLAHVLEADPQARVVVAPSDHYVADADAFTGAIAAAAAASSVPLTLVGAVPDRPETEYGWIEPGEVLDGSVRRVARFVEKPTPARARELFDRGALWNTFVIVAHGRRLWNLAEGKLPVQAALIQSCVSQSGPKGCCLACAYEQMEEAKFSSRGRTDSASSARAAAGSPTGDRPSGFSTRCRERPISIASLNGSAPRSDEALGGRSLRASLFVRDAAQRTPHGAERQEGSQP